MDKLVEIPLGKEAIEYITERLANGKSLARHVLQHVDLDRGSVRTLLPDYVSDAAARNLKAGGVLRRDAKDTHYVKGYRVELVPTLEKELASTIRDSLGQRLWVVEEGLGKASDPWVQSCPGRLLRNGEDVYELLDSTSPKEHVARAVGTANRPYPALLAFAISPSEPGQLDPITDEVDSEWFELAVNHLHQIVVGAYDGEAFIYWTPT